MDARQFVGRGDKDVQEFGVEMLVTVLTHEVDCMSDLKRGFVDSLGGKRIKGICDGGDAALDRKSVV